MLTGNDKSVDTLYKSRDQLVICLKTFKGFKLSFSVVAGFKNKIRNGANHGQSTRLEKDIRHRNFGMKLERIDSNAHYFLHAPFLNKRIKRNHIFRQLGSVIFLLRHLLKCK